MKKLIILSVLLFVMQGQAQEKIYQGNYYALPDIFIGKTFTASNGLIYNIYMNSKGKYYINKISKTGKPYKQYLKLVINHSFFKD